MIDKTGWYSGAKHVDAHPGRVGPPIKPIAVVAHTTDCAPGSLSGIVRRWATEKGNGACAHFLIGRDGVVTQMISVYRNGSHAGGVTHGWLWTAGKRLHPNTACVGIELDCAGALRRAAVGAPWIHHDSGREIPSADVQVDSRGRGWHCVTPAQYAALDALLRDLAAIAVAPADLSVTPNGTYQDNGVPWASMPAGAAVIGHATLDPNNKTDPGPFVMDWLRATAPSRES